MHDRVLTRHHRGGSFHAARRRRGSGRRGADGERPVQRRHDRRRQDPPPHRTGAGCAEAVKGPTAGRAPRFAEVVLPVPVSRTYTYEIPTALLERVVPGSRVVVPVQRRQVVGLVVAVDVPAPDVPAKPIAAAPDGEPALSAALIELGRWIGSYYGAPLGLALRALLPGALWSVRRPAGPPEQAERVIGLTPALPSLLERERAFRRAPQRRVGYEALEALGGSAPLRHLLDRLGLSRAVLDGLVKQRLARYTDVPRARDPFADLSSPPPPALTEAQLGVVSGIAGTPADIPILIHGVTGSGKTLVYLELLRGVVASGRGAILLVPEIALTPQTVARVRGVFGDQVAVLHSGLSDGERADAWRALRRGERRVAVGPRSAVFAPVERLGAIVVDEEHESSYKQGTAPRYHARDVALERARLEGARVILGSATPSLETLHLAAVGKVVRADSAWQLEAHHLRAARPNRRATLATGRGKRLAPGRAGTRRPRGTVDRGARRGRTRRSRTGRAGDPALEPARLRDVPAVSRLRRRAHLPPLRHRPHRPSGAGRAAVPLLRPRGADSHRLPGVRQRDPADAGPGDPTARAFRRAPVPRGPDRPHGSGHDEHQVGAPPGARPR